MRLPRIIAGAACVAALSVGAVTGAAATKANAYVVHNLVANKAGPADHVDPDLVNGWGLAARTTSPWWVADNGTDVATIYQADGTKASLTVSVPEGPTGEVANNGSNFVIASGPNSGPALFIFASEDGKIRAWNPTVTGTSTLVGADRSTVGAIYKGLAIASTPGGDFLYATDFHNGRVDVFDGSFNLVTTPGAFVDPDIPHRYAPFGIQTIGDRVFVTYAKQDGDAEDEVGGSGFGFVDAFDTSGNFLMRVASRGPLNAPWGLALAPAGFGEFGGDLLVGNFRGGHISAFTEEAGGFKFQGQLHRTNGRLITIHGLWALEFGLGATANGPTDTLFFTAGPNDEEDGLFGTIRAS